MRIRIGTRASALARWQASWVADQLQRLGADVEVIFLKTQGDVDRQSLGVIGGQGVFTKAIQDALLAKDVDLAVHSLKDLPTLPVPGLVLAASPKREACGDVLVSNRFDSVEALPSGASVGTGSARRSAQLRRRRPDLEVRDIRGNVDTRLRKMDDGEYDAIVLAEAGVTRLGLDDRIAERLPFDWMLPAIGQGALGLETREDEPEIIEFLGQLNHAETLVAVQAERAMLRRLDAGCLAPVAAWARLDESQRLKLSGAVLHPSGEQRVYSELDGDLGAAVELGAKVAEQLLKQGADRLIHLESGNG